MSHISVPGRPSNVPARKKLRITLARPQDLRINEENKIGGKPSGYVLQ